MILFTTLGMSEYANFLCYVIARLVISILLPFYVYNRNVALHYPEGLKSKRVVRTNGRSVLMIRGFKVRVSCG